MTELLRSHTTVNITFGLEYINVVVIVGKC